MVMARQLTCYIYIHPLVGYAASRDMFSSNMQKFAFVSLYFALIYILFFTSIYIAGFSEWRDTSSVLSFGLLLYNISLVFYNEHKLLVCVSNKWRGYHPVK